MRVVNRSTHPTAEVTRIVRTGYGPGATPQRVIVHERSSRRDDRQGFTPFDHGVHTDLWIEPANRYPQPGNASTWEQELLMSSAHEAYHFRHGDSRCPRGNCERPAEGRARRAVRGALCKLRPAWCGHPRGRW